jgi:hypothetical protein
MTKPKLRAALGGACKSCGVPWIDHAGCQVICSQLGVAVEALGQIASLPRGGRAKRLAVSTIALLKHCQ